MTKTSQNKKRKMAKYDRSPNGKQRRIRYMKSHPEEVKAKTALNNAIQAGRVVKPSHCSRCGKPFPKRLIQAHHKDYTKPLKPTWVCPRCHAILDAKRRNGK